MVWKYLQDQKTLWRSWHQIRPWLTLAHWRKLLSRPEEDLTVLFMSRGHRGVRKLHFSPKLLWATRWMLLLAGIGAVISVLSVGTLLTSWTEWMSMKHENQLLRAELNRIQYHLDTLQTSVDRISRFDKKLRALTDVDKEFAKWKGPTRGQGGGDQPDDEYSGEVFDFGDYRIEGSQLAADAGATEYLDRRDAFYVQKIYSWMRRLFRDAELESQSIEELFELLKGREIQLAATPSLLPVRGWVTSHFGFRLDPFTSQRALHRGIDIAAREGAPVQAPADGIVTFAGSYGTYGNTVMIFHGYGVSTLYAHGQEILTRPGQKIRRGDTVMTVGRSGRAAGPHLHYEVVVQGVRVDPRKYILDRSL